MIDPFLQFLPSGETADPTDKDHRDIINDTLKLTTLLVPKSKSADLDVRIPLSRKESVAIHEPARRGKNLAGSSGNERASSNRLKGSLDEFCEMNSDKDREFRFSSSSSACPLSSCLPPLPPKRAESASLPVPRHRESRRSEIAASFDPTWYKNEPDVHGVSGSNDGQFLRKMSEEIRLSSYKVKDKIDSGTKTPDLFSCNRRKKGEEIRAATDHGIGTRLASLAASITNLSFRGKLSRHTSAIVSEESSCSGESFAEADDAKIQEPQTTQINHAVYRWSVANDTSTSSRHSDSDKPMDDAKRSSKAGEELSGSESSLSSVSIKDLPRTRAQSKTTLPRSSSQDGEPTERRKSAARPRGLSRTKSRASDDASVATTKTRGSGSRRSRPKESDPSLGSEKTRRSEVKTGEEPTSSESSSSSRKQRSQSSDNHQNGERVKSPSGHSRDHRSDRTKSVSKPRSESRSTNRRMDDISIASAATTGKLKRQSDVSSRSVSQSRCDSRARDRKRESRTVNEDTTEIRRKQRDPHARSHSSPSRSRPRATQTPRGGEENVVNDAENVSLSRKTDSGSHRAGETVGVSRRRGSRGDDESVATTRTRSRVRGDHQAPPKTSRPLRRRMDDESVSSRQHSTRRGSRDDRSVVRRSESRTGSSRDSEIADAKRRRRSRSHDDTRSCSSFQPSTARSKAKVTRSCVSLAPSRVKAVEDSESRYAWEHMEDDERTFSEYKGRSKSTTRPRLKRLSMSKY